MNADDIHGRTGVDASSKNFYGIDHIELGSSPSSYTDALNIGSCILLLSNFYTCYLLTHYKIVIRVTATYTL